MRKLTSPGTAGQDLLEYALMAGFVAVVVAAAMPGVAAGVSNIFSQISFSLSEAASQGDLLPLPTPETPSGRIR